MAMPEIFLSMIFSIILWNIEQCGATDVCVTVAPVDSWVLTGHVFKTKEGTTLSRCTFYCEIEQKCMSINFILRTDACELNAATKEMFPNDFNRKENALYVHNILRERDPCTNWKCQNNGSCLASSGQQLVCLCSPGFTGSLCEISIPPIKGQPLGMESGQIADNQVRSKSSFGSCYPWNGRLNFLSSWIARATNQLQWLGVTFETTVVLFSQIATQGSPTTPCWVTRYALEYYGTNYQWTKYKENGIEKIYIGNTNQNTIVKNTIKTPFEGTYIKVKPYEWFNQICMRLELYGTNKIIAGTL